jgi:hypothetical protein
MKSQTVSRIFVGAMVFFIAVANGMRDAERGAQQRATPIPTQPSRINNPTSETTYDLSRPSQQAEPFAIAYLMSDSPVAQLDNLTRDLDIDVVESWAAVLRYDDQFKIDALLLDSEILDSVDATWLAEAYQRGVVLTFFDPDPKQIADLLHDPSLEARTVSPEPSSFMTVWRISGASHGGQGTRTDTLATANGYAAFVFGMANDLMGIQEEMAAFPMEQR